MNIEAFEELDHIQAIAKKMNKTATVVFRLNPDIAAGGDDKIMTARARDKFGMSPDRVLEAYKHCETLSHVKAVGLSMHLGSQISQLWLFQKGYKIFADIVKSIRAQGFTVERTDIGGGFGIRYQNEELLTPMKIAEAIRDYIVPLGTEIIVEPGRYLVGNAGLLVSEILLVKKTTEKQFLVCDFAMNDIMRPSLYDAWHGLIPVKEPKPDQELVAYDVVGPVCESGDTFTKDRIIPECKTGDLIAVQSAGAYGACMSSNYNTRRLLPEILVQKDTYKLIRRRQSYEEILATENF